MIVAVDATVSKAHLATGRLLTPQQAELDLYPNGEDIHNTYLKSLLPGYDIPFPVIPPPWTFVAQKLNKRPVFFGSACYTQPNSLITPLIVCKRRRCLRGHRHSADSATPVARSPLLLHSIPDEYIHGKDGIQTCRARRVL